MFLRQLLKVRWRRAVVWTVGAAVLCIIPWPISGNVWQETGWVTEFEQGLQQARSSGRPAFVYFDAVWCSWCQQYKRDTLDQARVRTMLLRDYVAVRVDYDARPDLFQRYGGGGLPFTLMLAPDGRLLNRFVGVMTPDDLVDLLTQFAQIKARALTSTDTDYRVIRVDSLERRSYEKFRRAFMDHLESLYHSESQTLAGRFETGATLKRPSPLTWMYLHDHGLWPEHGRLAAAVERRQLLDRHDGGFFNFLDPSRLTEEYVETSKILESNAWLSAWMAQLGRRDRAAFQATYLGWFYLRETLWDTERGGFWQAQIADSDYYSLSPAQRLRRHSPPIDYAKRADTNAQAAWALVRMGRYTGDAQMIDRAAHTIDFILSVMVRDGRLYHIWRDNRVAVPDLPADWFWLLAAGYAVDSVRPDSMRHARLAVITGAAASWLNKEMSRKDKNEAASSVELAGLIAWVASLDYFYRGLPVGTGEWALRQLRIEVETPPDELVIGLMAWEKWLDRRRRD